MFCSDCLRQVNDRCDDCLNIETIALNAIAQELANRMGMPVLEWAKPTYERIVYHEMGHAILAATTPGFIVKDLCIDEGATPGQPMGYINFTHPKYIIDDKVDDVMILNVLSVLSAGIECERHFFTEVSADAYSGDMRDMRKIIRNFYGNSEVFETQFAKLAHGQARTLIKEYENLIYDLSEEIIDNKLTRVEFDSRGRMIY